MKLERFMLLSYGLLVCSASILLFVGTLVAILFKLSKAEADPALPGTSASLEILARTPNDHRRVYLDENNVFAPPTGAVMDPQANGRVFPEVASFKPGVSNFEARLQLLQKGEQVGRQQATGATRASLRIAQYSVHIGLILTALGLFVFHWRWLRTQLARGAGSSNDNHAASDLPSTSP